MHIHLISLLAALPLAFSLPTPSMDAPFNYEYGTTSDPIPSDAPVPSDVQGEVYNTVIVNGQLSRLTPEIAKKNKILIDALELLYSKHAHFTFCESRMYEALKDIDFSKISRNEVVIQEMINITNKSQTQKSIARVLSDIRRKGPAWLAKKRHYPMWTLVVVLANNMKPGIMSGQELLDTLKAMHVVLVEHEGVLNPATWEMEKRICTQAPGGNNN